MYFNHRHHVRLQRVSVSTPRNALDITLSRTFYAVVRNILNIEKTKPYLVFMVQVFFRKRPSSSNQVPEPDLVFGIPGHAK